MGTREPHPRTISTLDKLDEVVWFARVGRDEFRDAVQLNSWREALASASSPNWEEVTLEMANQLSAKVLEADARRFADWNEIVNVVKEFSNALVFDKASQTAKENSLDKVFMDCVQWDIFHLCLEAEFADIVKPSFYHAIAFYYLKGHFPCGVVKTDSGVKQTVF